MTENELLFYDLKKVNNKTDIQTLKEDTAIIGGFTET